MKSITRRLLLAALTAALATMSAFGDETPATTLTPEQVTWIEQQRTELAQAMLRGASGACDATCHDAIDPLGAFVIDHASHVAIWRNGDASRVNTGKNIRVWRRAPAGGLKMICQAGTYD